MTVKYINRLIRIKQKALDNAAFDEDESIAIALYNEIRRLEFKLYMLEQGKLDDNKKT